MVHRSRLTINDQILLANISHIARFFVLSEQVIEGLIAVRSNFFGDRFVPFFAVCKDRVDIKDHTAKVEQAVAHNITNAKSAAYL